ncbi:class I SAM-dependent methyltransferase [Halanaeroarchaeum sp. HSR-CO]|uniref:class I SAM-dependent methyltransferase n=1 Tax=Halanaeroarchaeum sp. HSR-CO TaxID=2866382 RepID=UPI00217D0C56|nr:class I SAM-dependent methyltransferase [Halanaeroarchaeum sp. HSR-CO]
MGPTEAFETQTGRYEEWFEENEPTYRSEVRALDRFVDTGAFGLEIGIGTGRFAEPLGIDVGIDPALEMLEHAVERERSVVQGVAEWLPFQDDVFDVALIVTTICFVDDIERTLEEAGRVLHADGRLVMGYIDRESEYGRHYQAIKDENPFYRDATFVSTDELLADLDALGYGDVDIVQTVFGSPGEHDEVDEPRPGYGEGSFVALSARAPN